MAKPVKKKKLISSYRRGKIDATMTVRAWPDEDRPGRWWVAQGQKLVGTSRAFALRDVKFVVVEEEAYYLEGMVAEDVNGIDPRQGRLKTEVALPEGPTGFRAADGWEVLSADAVLVNGGGVFVDFFYGDRRTSSRGWQ
jgi:hypothetical protein